MLEIYKTIKDFPNYQISNYGHVRKTNTGKMRTLRIVKSYFYADLYYKGIRKNCRVARLVAKHFIKNSLNKPEVNHKDGNKLNDYISNLEWTTDAENKQHAHRLKLYPLSKGNMKFSRGQVDSVFKLRKEGFKHREIAQKTGMGVSTVTHALLGTRRSKQ